ncbi:MAG: YraN family protein [Thermodesulfobacteriota bacterium]
MDLINYLKSKLTRTNITGDSQNDLGEMVACRFLKKKGFLILEKNFRSRYGEIDIIAKDSDVICFIEVKSRKSIYFGLPEEYVDKRKQKKLLKTSLIYLSGKGNSDIDKRFDVISVDLKNNTCRKIKNAFDAEF